MRNYKNYVLAGMLTFVLGSSTLAHAATTPGAPAGTGYSATALLANGGKQVGGGIEYNGVLYVKQADGSYIQQDVATPQAPGAPPAQLNAAADSHGGKPDYRLSCSYLTNTPQTVDSCRNLTILPSKAPY